MVPDEAAYFYMAIERLDMSKIVFLCVANSARSQMAEGLARSLFKKEIEVASAGSQPSQVNPFAIEAMKEIGIDITSHHSKPMAEVLGDDVHLVITLCAEEVCPVVGQKTERLHWPMTDPAGVEGSPAEVLRRFGQIRDEIRSKLMEFGRERSLLQASEEA